MPFPPTFTDVWSTTTPPDTQLLNQGALDFRNLKLDVMQRMSLLSGTFANRPAPETVNAVWGGSGFGLTYFATDTRQFFQWNGTAWIEVGYSLPTVGGSMFFPAGAQNFVIWRAPFACTVTRLYGSVGGATGSVINASHNAFGTTMFSNLSLGSLDTWIDGGAPTGSSAFASGDLLGLNLVSVNGSPTYITWQINFTRP